MNKNNDISDSNNNCVTAITSTSSSSVNIFNQQIFSINGYFQLTNVSDSCGYQFHDIFRAKTTGVYHDWQRQHFMFLILRTREGLMSPITKLRLSPSEETPFKHA